MDVIMVLKVVAAVIWLIPFSEVVNSKVISIIALAAVIALEFVIGFWEAAGIAVFVLIVAEILKNVGKNRTEEKEKTEDESNTAPDSAPKTEYYRTVPHDCFYNVITSEEFQLLAWKTAKHFNRVLNVSVNGAVVTGIVETQSGNSHWEFKADFACEGTITGGYSLQYSNNQDSDIPENFCKSLGYQIYLKRNPQQSYRP